MRTWLMLALLGALLCLATAKNGSMSDDMFEDDVNDDEPIQFQEADAKPKNERKNLCNRKKCYRGEMCETDENGEPECVCVPTCDFYRRSGDRHKVCSNKNETYASECDLDRDHCLCKHKQEGCTHPGARKIQLEYYGSCQELHACEEDSRVQFPERMRTWLFIVMETMANRAEIGEYEQLLEEAKADKNHSYAAIWGFCDLDKDPQDRHVSRRELQYTVRSLKVLEHCLVPFLDECDENDDRKITLHEWGQCLAVPHDKITDRCKDIHEKRNKAAEN